MNFFVVEQRIAFITLRSKRQCSCLFANSSCYTDRLSYYNSKVLAGYSAGKDLIFVPKSG